MSPIDIARALLDTIRLSMNTIGIVGTAAVLFVFVFGFMYLGWALVIAFV